MKPNLQFVVFTTTSETKTVTSISLRCMLDKIKNGNNDNRRCFRENNGSQRIDTVAVNDDEFVRWNLSVILTNQSRRIFAGGIVHYKKDNVPHDQIFALKKHLQSFDYIIAEWSYEDCMTFECLVR